MPSSVDDNEGFHGKVGKHQEEEKEEEIRVSVASEPVLRSHRDASGSDLLGSIQDHFTLPSQSSTVRFRSSVLRVFPDANSSSQFVLETCVNDDDKTEATMKRMHDSSLGINALRATYSLVTVYLVGILAVYSIMFLFSLLTDLTIQAKGEIYSFMSIGGMIGILLSLPVVVYGLASCLVYCGSFTSDTWMGSPLLKRYCFSHVSEVLFQWMLFVAFIGLPALVMCGTLCAVNFDWWMITLLTWFCSIATLFCLYTLTVAYFETNACWNLTKSIRPDCQSFWQTLRATILLHQLATFSGYKKVSYVALRPPDSVEDGDEGIIMKTHVETRSVYTRMTLWGMFSQRWKVFEILTEPHRLVPICEAQGVTTFLTANTWSLERVYCQARNPRTVAIVKGPNAVTRTQMISSLVCACFGQVLVMLLIASILVFMGQGVGICLFFVAIALIFWIIPDIIRQSRTYQSVNNISKSSNEPHDETNLGNVVDDANDDEGHAVFCVQDTFRLTKPSPTFSWCLFFLEIVLFFVWPLCALYVLGNAVVAVEFTIISIFAFLRRFCNPATALQEVGTIRFANRKQNGQDSDEWKQEARFCRILDDVTVNRGRYHWMVILSFILVFFVFVSSIAIAIDGPADRSGVALRQEIFLPEFEYIAAVELPYPSCTISQGFLPNVEVARLLDFAFVAYVAYKDDSITQDQLNRWFGDGVAELRDDTISQFLAETNTANSPGSYKLIQFANVSIVTIRGTFWIWDLFADAQLWMTACMVQILRAILPLGFVWTPILDVIVAAISALQSETLKKVSFYKETTAFVKYLQESNVTGSVALTGHSLGGGLAIISAAQTGAPAVAISGPNAMLSRRTFDPPLSVDALNRYTFNVIPDRDPIAHIDDVARLFQRINCNADPNKIFDCHEIERTICELMVRCGTSGRPPFCSCVTMFSYPKPIQMGNQTFEEACGISP